jgi:hypothetical protein
LQFVKVHFLRLRIRESDNCTLAYVALNHGNGQEIGKLLNFKIVKISGIHIIKSKLLKDNKTRDKN